MISLNYYTARLEGVVRLFSQALERWPKRTERLAWVETLQLVKRFTFQQRLYLSSLLTKLQKMLCSN